MKPLILLVPVVSLLAFLVFICANFVEAWSSFHPTSKYSLPPSTTSLLSTLQTDVSTTEADITSNEGKRKNTWFPIHPADALSPSNDYNSLVKSAYLRHILVASEDMADLIMEVYLKGGSLPGKEEEETYAKTEGDIFTRLARDVSLCAASREDGGKIGWVDNPLNRENTSDKMDKTNSVVHEMISPEVIQMVFEERVKGGDVRKLPASDGKSYHIIRVDDLHIQLNPSSMVAGAGSKNIINKKGPNLFHA